VAPEGTVVLPPGAETRNEDETSSTASSSESSEDKFRDPELAESAVDFVSDQCLFCGQLHGTFEASLAHMKKVHSFVVPYQPLLSVDLETLVSYLHLAVFRYRECLFCSKRRDSVEAVQQHMLAKGHCRYDLTEEHAGFYNSEAFQKSENTRPDETSMRLPSGKVLTSRFDAQAMRAKARPSSDTQKQHSLSLSQPASSNSELINRQEQKAAAYETQLSCLSASDQRSLVHLSSAEQRSVLAIRKKQLEKAQREDRRARSVIERLGNKTLMKHFKNDVPGRSNG
jgi:pre-60S factor REI1